VCGAKTAPDGNFWAAFNAPRHPKHSGEARVPRRQVDELWPGGFPSLLSLLFF